MRDLNLNQHSAIPDCAEILPAWQVLARNYRGFFQAIPDGAYAFRIQDGFPREFFEVNDECCRLLGYARKEMLGLNILDVTGLSGRGEIAALMQRFSAAGPCRMELEHTTKAGARITLQLSAQVAMEPDHTTVFCVLRPPVAPALLGAGSQFKGMDRQLEQTQKLETLGLLAGGIAHDLNSLLMAVLGHADLALADLPQSDPQRNHLQAIEKASQRAAELCREMLAYSGRGQFCVGEVHLRELVEEMIHLLQASISKKATLNLDLERGAPAITGNPTQLRQVLMNLVLNAAEAVGDEAGTVTVSTGVMHCSAKFLQASLLHENRRPGRYVWLRVTDTGCGMDSQTLDHLFEPFFTTKVKGRGLGMSAVLGIVREHGGAINVESTPHRGTTFQILFPVGHQPTVASAAPPPATKEWKAKGVLLLVDDEEPVRTLGSRMLARLGFDVVTANDGAHAVEVYSRSQKEIHGVLLDVSMPRMNGEEALKELRKINPEVRVAFCSGYTEQEISRRLHGLSGAIFVQKPYTLVQLGEQMQRLLAES